MALGFIGTVTHYDSRGAAERTQVEKSSPQRNQVCTVRPPLQVSTPDYIRRGRSGFSIKQPRRHIHGSSVMTTATLRHSNQTTCQTSASSEILRLLSSQLQSLPQQQLTSLLIQAISANSPQTITPTSRTTSGTPISPTTCTTSTTIPASTQTITFNLMPQPLLASTPFTQTDPNDRLSEA